MRAAPQLGAQGPSSQSREAVWARIKHALRRDWAQTRTDFTGDGEGLRQTVGDTVLQAAGVEPIPPWRQANEPARRWPDWERAEPAIWYGFVSRGELGARFPTWTAQVDEHLAQGWDEEATHQRYDEVREAVRMGWNAGSRAPPHQDDGAAVNSTELPPLAEGQSARCFVASFEHHPSAEAGLEALDADGFELRRLSVVGRDSTTGRRGVGCWRGSQGLRFAGTHAGVWNALAERLTPSGLFVLPSVGAVVVMGPLVSALERTFERAGRQPHAAVLGAALELLGVPQRSVAPVADEVEAGKCLLLARGSEADLESARAALERSGGAQFTAHAP